MTDIGFHDWIAKTTPEWAGRCHFLPEVLERDRDQPEKTVSIWVYLDRVLSDHRIAQGRLMAETWADALSKIEAHFGLSRYVILAIWGLETNYGANRGDIHVPSALATLAYRAGTSRRRDMFLAQLQALSDIQHIPNDNLRGSWAGAMGHTQFMPQAYRDYAIAYTGDRPADIWADDPRDALTSTARYLVAHGAVSHEIDVHFCYLDTDFDYGCLEFPVNGTHISGLHDGKTYRGMAPYGSHGPVVFLGPNAQAIYGYNHSLHYVLAVVFLAQKLAYLDVPPVDWPVDLDILSRAEIQRVQQYLVDLGYDTNGVDGIWGAGSRRALRQWQVSVGHVADGYPTLQVLAQLSGQ